MDENQEIEELSKRLNEARVAYYNLDPVLNDQEYDALKNRLAQLCPTHEEVIAVGAPVDTSGTWEKAVHEIPMGSLDKVNTHDEFEEWANKTQSEDFIICHKFDGASLEVVYKDGKLIRTVSRGDGLVGEDVTKNGAQIPSIPKLIKIKGDLVIRGEVIMHKSVFQEKYAAEYSNPRNTAVGKMRDRKTGGSSCKDLSFYAYTAIGETFSTEQEQFEFLERNGFLVSWYATGGLGAIKEAFEWLKRDRNLVQYEIDGAVIRILDLRVQEELGSLNMRPRGQIAWKFDPATGITKVMEIKWQVGVTGRLCPVAVVEPVEVGGVTITNISLHNLSMFNSLKLFKGCSVLVSRRNDVIPYVEKNLDESS